MEYIHDKQMESEGEAGGRGKRSHDSRGAPQPHDQEDRVNSDYNEEASPPYISDKNKVCNSRS